MESTVPGRPPNGAADQELDFVDHIATPLLKAPPTQSWLAFSSQKTASTAPSRPDPNGEKTPLEYTAMFFAAVPWTESKEPPK